MKMALFAPRTLRKPVYILLRLKPQIISGIPLMPRTAPASYNAESGARLEPERRNRRVRCQPDG